MTAPSPATRAELPDPDALAAAVQGCPSVSALSGGRLGEVATYLPGRRVAGIRLGDDTVDIHVVGHYGPHIDTIAAEVRSAVRPLVGGRQVAVSVDDLDTGDLDLDPEPAGP